MKNLRLRFEISKYIFDCIIEHRSVIVAFSHMSGKAWDATVLEDKFPENYELRAIEKLKEYNPILEPKWTRILACDYITLPELTNPIYTIEFEHETIVDETCGTVQALMAIQKTG